MSDDDSKDKAQQATNRRRVSQVVHDERGNARVEWIDAGLAGVPIERAPLTIESTPARGVVKLSVERTRAGGFDPYARVGAAHIPVATKKPPVKKDLRKLGEWIKLKRELDERKTQDDPDVE